MTPAMNTPFENTFEDFVRNTKRFFKRVGLRIVDFGEGMGCARAASELASLGRYDAARAVIENYHQCSEARSRLIRRLKS